MIWFKKIGIQPLFRGMSILIMDSLPATVDGLERYLPELSVDTAQDFHLFEEKVKTITYDCLILEVSEMEGSSTQRTGAIRSADKRSGERILKSQFFFQIEMKCWRKF